MVHVFNVNCILCRKTYKAIRLQYHFNFILKKLRSHSHPIGKVIRQSRYQWCQDLCKLSVISGTTSALSCAESSIFRHPIGVWLVKQLCLQQEPFFIDDPISSCCDVIDVRLCTNPLRTLCEDPILCQLLPAAYTASQAFDVWPFL